MAGAGVVAVEDDDELGRHERDLRPLMPVSAIWCSCSAAGAARARAGRRAHSSSGRTGSGPGRSGRRAGAEATSRTPRPRRPRLERREQPDVVRRAPGGGWFISVRADERAWSRSPVTARTPTSARSTTTGSPRSVPLRSTSLCASWSGAPGTRRTGSCRGRSRIAVQRHGAGAEPNVQEVTMVRRRSQTLARLTSSVHRRPGSGYRRASARAAARWPGQLGVALARSSRSAGPRRPLLAHLALLRRAHAKREQQQQRDHAAGDVEEQVLR